MTHQRFATGDDHKHLMGITTTRHTVEHTQEIVLWHILSAGECLTIATTMAAAQITAQGTLPEQLLQGMILQHVLFAFSPKFQGDSLFQG
jgi:hypothetical protein